jgi:hypothetical protein
MRAGVPSGDTDDDDEGMYGGGAGEGDAEDIEKIRQSRHTTRHDVTVHDLISDAPPFSVEASSGTSGRQKSRTVDSGFSIGAGYGTVVQIWGQIVECFQSF